jgi:nucleoid-associated protein YgaU
MFSPELAGMNLQADGKPVALEMPQMQTMGVDAFAALSDDAIAISVGAGAETELESMLSADTLDSAPFLSFSVDAERYYGFLGDAIAAGDPDSEKAPSPEMQAALTEIMLAVADIYDRMSADVRFTSRGVEIDSSVTLKD